MIYVLIAVLLLSIAPAIICYKKNYKKIMCLILAFDFSFALAVFAYYWVPSEEYDLSRYYTWMNNMQVFKGDILINYLFFERGEPITMVYFYIISLIDNYSLLPFFPTLISYFIMFYIIIDYCQINKYSNKMTIFLILLFISLFKYIFLVSGIRSTFAMILCTLALYEEFIKSNKKWYIKLLYVIALGIHNGVIAIIFVRILLNINKILKMKTIRLIFTIITIIVISILLLILFSDKIEFLAFIKEKIISYINIKPIISLQSIFRSLQLFLFAGILFLVWKNKIYDNVYTEDMQKYYKFLQILTIICLIAFIYYDIWIRYLDFILFLELPIIANLLTSYKDKKNKEYIVLITILTVLIIGGIRIQIPIFADMNIVLK